ncbi:hypothetical protein [Plantactinospora sp. KLBMP9567]|uniref:hypothetical protein n=1 Tax=Plantactinospora sp. KLBMP9567 TaxID=3085900 RepID=UPI0029812FDD|nr:hypothetical protein [Plantactinospora sp. KLBMP9567]MDW5330161.1 hypothetical protein [Plantactinospora sp. KLBMP9567]
MSRTGRSPGKRPAPDVGTDSRAGGTRAVRIALVVLGTATAAYGGSLMPRPGPVLPWLVAGPLLHDVLVAPLIGLVGLVLGRLVTDRTTRTWIGAGLTVTATLLVIAVPLLWRPAPAPPNPGLQDRDYLVQLTVWLAVLWAGLAIGYRIRRRATRRQVDGEPDR